MILAYPYMSPIDIYQGIEKCHDHHDYRNHTNDHSATEAQR